MFNQYMDTMKTAFGILFSLFMALSLTSFGQAQEAVKADVEWVKETYDFGKIPQNKPVVAVFEVKNISMTPLILQHVKPSCGCTVADYPKEPIQPGQTAKITAQYNAKNPGVFTKTVRVTSNAKEGTKTLYIKGEVVVN